MAESSNTAVRVAVRGRVQGVGFRDATRRRALELGVRGWVRNEDGGAAVLVHAEGAPAAVEELLAFLHAGPPAAQVADVAVERVRVEGHEQFAVRGVPAGRFAVEEGERGFVLRLEVAGGVRAWALAKAPSTDPAVKRLAIELPPGGALGDATGAPASGADAGAPPPPSAWDRGPYEQGGRVPWPEAIERGHAVFVLHGERLTGGFALQRTRAGERPQWLLIKRRER